jgi:hypothetical protein
MRMSVHLFLRPQGALAVPTNYWLAYDAGYSAIVLVAFHAALGLEVGLVAALAPPPQAEMRVPHMLFQVLLVVEVSARGC